MTFRALLEHELAWYKNVAKLRFLGGWKVKLKGKRLTVIVYKATYAKKPKIGQKIQYRLAVSYDKQVLTSLIIGR